MKSLLYASLMTGCCLQASEHLPFEIAPEFIQSFPRHFIEEGGTQSSDLVYSPKQYAVEDNTPVSFTLLRTEIQEQRSRQDIAETPELSDGYYKTPLATRRGFIATIDSQSLSQQTTRQFITPLFCETPSSQSTTFSPRTSTSITPLFCDLFVDADQQQSTSASTSTLKTLTHPHQWMKFKKKEPKRDTRAHQLAEKYPYAGPWICYECQQVISGRSKKKLVYHLLSHTQELPFVCDWPSCAKGFKTTTNLKVHQRSHTGERPYSCGWEGYTKAFTTSTKLTDHQRRKHSIDGSFEQRKRLHKEHGQEEA